MKKFILKLIIGIILIYLLLLGLQFTIDFYLKKDSCCNNNTWYQIYKGKVKSDIVVFGTSRAESHYDTEIISKITGLKTYNLGLSGTHYNILKIRWKSYLNHNSKPKILILDLDSSSLQDLTEIFNKFQYLPYLSTTEYGTVAKEVDSDFYFEKFIPIYKYRGYEMSIYKQIKSLKDPFYCYQNVNGYVEHDIKWIERDFRVLKNQIEKNKVKDKFNGNQYKNGFKVLEEIIEDCKQNNIKVVFVWSPSYYESNLITPVNKKCIDQLLKKISKQNKIEYYNFSNDSLGLKKENFYNSAHMNKNGVAIFSKKIGEIIKDRK